MKSDICNKFIDIIAWTYLGYHYMTITLKDDENQYAYYYYTVTYTNSAPYFKTAPASLITTQFNQQAFYTLPPYMDNEGHAIQVATNLPSTYVWFNSMTNQFIVNPINAGNCGTFSFYFWLTDTNLISAIYTMTTTVTNTKPDFSTVPALKSITNPFKMHVMTKLSIDVPTQVDAEGGSLTVYTWDSSALAGVTNIQSTYDSTNNKVNVQSLQILDAGTMDPVTLSGKATHQMIIRIQDSCSLVSDYYFYVEVFNTAPQLDPVGYVIPNQEVSMNSMLSIDLSPHIKDMEGDSFGVAFVQMQNNVYTSLPTFFSVSLPATLNVHPTTFLQIGTYKVRAQIYDYLPYSSLAYFDVKVTNYAPVFLKQVTLKDQRIRFNNSFDLVLPSYADPEGSMVYIVQWSTPNIIYKFTTLTPAISPSKVVIYPTDWNQLGTYQVITYLTDTNNASFYTWQLEVYNTAPYFDGGKKPGNQNLRFNSTLEYLLPKCSDDEFNPIVVINKMPKFMTFDQTTFKYIIAPTIASTDLGTFTVNGMISDTKMNNEFKFTVTVFNDPPYFKQPLVDTITVGVGQNRTYNLPLIEDKEGMPFKITCQIKSPSGPLPSFIKFDEANKQFDFSPIKLTQLGTYEIQVILDDFYSNPSMNHFRVTIEDTIRNKKSDAANNTKVVQEIVQASFKILQVTREGKCRVKIIATKGSDILTKLIASDTFKIVILTKAQLLVPYIIDLVDATQNIVTLKLSFKDSKKISSTTVNPSLTFLNHNQELDRIEVRVINEPEYKSSELMCYLPYDSNQQAPIPPQVNSCEFLNLQIFIVAASFASKFSGGVNIISSTALPISMAVNLSMQLKYQMNWSQVVFHSVSVGPVERHVISNYQRNDIDHSTGHGQAHSDGTPQFHLSRHTTN